MGYEFHECAYVDRNNVLEIENENGRKFACTYRVQGTSIPRKPKELQRIMAKSERQWKVLKRG